LLWLGTNKLKSINNYTKNYFDENNKLHIFVSMKKLFFFIVLLLGIVSCTSPKKALVKMPKWEKEHIGSKRQIRKYTKVFVKNLYDTTKSNDSVETIIQN
jgi:hypothetical protein